MPEEMFDIVDDDDVVIGQEKRSVVHRSGLQHRGVHVLLFTPDGKLLVQQRSRDRQASPSSLDCSVSEHVKAGEDYLSAAQRGLLEELGLENLELQPLITFRLSYGPNDNEITRIFQGTLADSAQVDIDPVEVDWVATYSLPELQALRAGGATRFSYWFEQILLWMTGQPQEMQITATHGNLNLRSTTGG